MSSIGNKVVFSKNLRHYIEKSGKDRRELSEIWGFPYSTVTVWVNGKKYPRIDRIEKMADYFGIKKSDLIEEKEPDDMREKNDTAVGSKGDVLDEVDIAFYNHFKELDEDQQETVRDMVKVMRERRSKKQG